MDFMMALGQMPLWVLAIVMVFSAGFMGLPESSEAKAAYVKFLMILAFFYFGSFLMRLRYKSM